MSFSTLRDIIQNYGMVCETYENSPVWFDVRMECAWNKEEGNAYGRWRMVETYNNKFVAMCFFGTRQSVIDALMDIADITPEEEERAINSGKSYCQKLKDEMFERIDRERARDGKKSYAEEHPYEPKKKL